MHSAYLPAVKPIGSVCSGPHTVYHARFRPCPSSVLAEAPVTEVMTINFPAKYSLHDQETYDNGISKFFEECHTHADGFCLAVGVGWMKCKNSRVEKRSKFVALFGWESVKHHLAFRETTHFKELRENMGQPKDLRKIEAVHVKVTEPMD